MKEAVLASKRLYEVGMYRREWTVFSAYYYYSDTSANEDNSFRNHIR